MKDESLILAKDLHRLHNHGETEKQKHPDGALTDR